MGLIDVVKKAQSLSPSDAEGVGLTGLKPTWILAEETCSPEVGNGEFVSRREVPGGFELLKQREGQEELLIADLKAKPDESLSLSFLDRLLRSYLEQVLSPNSNSNANLNPGPKQTNVNAECEAIASSGKRRVPRTDFAKLLKKASPLLGQKLLSLTLRACLVSESFDAVRAMLDSHALSGNTNPDLVSSLIEHDQAALLCIWVRNVCDPRFSDLLLVLKYFLKSSLRAGMSLAAVRLQWFQSASVAVQKLSDMNKAIESNEEGKGSGNDEETADALAHMKKKSEKEEAIVRALLLSAAFDHFQPFELCLHYLVSCGHDEAVLTSILSQLENNEVSKLLRYLRKWLEKYSRRSSLCSVKSKDLWVPSLSEVVQWASILLDAHLMSLVLCSDFHEEIRSVQSLIKDFVDVGHKLAPLVGVTEHLRATGPLPIQTSSYRENDHVIEYLEI